jgi:hypothetical protein
MKEPISLTRSYQSDFPVPAGPDDTYCPIVDLSQIKGLEELPLEGEIRFRYSRIRQSTTEDETGTHYSATLKLKLITDICDCDGATPEYDEPRAKAADVEAVLDELMDELEELEEDEDLGYD